MSALERYFLFVLEEADARRDLRGVHELADAWAVYLKAIAAAERLRWPWRRREARREARYRLLEAVNAVLEPQEVQR